MFITNDVSESTINHDVELNNLILMFHDLAVFINPDIKNESEVEKIDWKK